MPVDDTDNRAAVHAVLEGRLQPWPRVLGVPRRLGRLVQQCVRRDPELRPSSARELWRRFSLLGVGRGPLLSRLSAVAALAAVLLALLGSDGGEPPFLRQRPGSALAFSDRPPAAGDEVAFLPASSIDRLGFYFGGIAPARSACRDQPGRHPVAQRAFVAAGRKPRRHARAGDRAAGVERGRARCARQQPAGPGRSRLGGAGQGAVGRRAHASRCQSAGRDGRAGRLRPRSVRGVAPARARLRRSRAGAIALSAAVRRCGRARTAVVAHRRDGRDRPRRPAGTALRLVARPRRRPADGRRARSGRQRTRTRVDCVRVGRRRRAACGRGHRAGWRELPGPPRRQRARSRAPVR